MNVAFAFRYAARNLLRGGQRTLLATVCVAFGVMSLVGLQLLSSMIAASITLDARFVLGGDASLSREGRAFGAPDIEALEAMRAEGKLAAFTLTTHDGGALLKRGGAGRSYLIARALGVDPLTFPLVGEMRLGGASQDSFGGLIDKPGTAVITRDVADRVGLAAGDDFTLGGPGVGPSRLRVTGIVELTPDRQGNAVYYSLATARRLAGREDVAASARVLWGPSRPTGETLAAEGWTVARPEEIAKQRARAVDLFGLMLKGAGILGLLLGGIGLSNTMQVLMARRRLEIATLKTLGYERRHLVILFGLETGMLGLIGGLAGAAAGAGLSSWLGFLLARTGPIMLGSAINPLVLAGGVATGASTAVIFGLHAIVKASAVRPSTLLRDLPVPKAWGETILLYSVLGALFSALAAAIMGSVLKGIGVVAAGFGGLAVLIAVLGAGFFAVVMVPVPLPSLVMLARKNLRRQPMQQLVALVALFCGVFTIGFAAATISSGRQRLSTQELPRGGYNITIYAASADADPVSAVLEREGVKDVHRFVTAPGKAAQVSFTGRVDERRLDAIAKSLGHEAPDTLMLTRPDLSSAMQGELESLFAFVVATAGLALVAGGVLIANSVGLAMLDRRREMGIFKAIGYSSARILAGIAVEYALLGLVAGIAGMGAVAIAFKVINHLRPAARLALDLAQAPAMIAVATAIALASAVAVAWRPTHARPLDVLRQEG
jgi:putative ABC transport system permease protein